MSMLNVGMSMFASADCLKDCASLYDELCLLFRLLFSAFEFCQCSWGNFPGCVVVFIASSSPVEGRGCDSRGHIDQRL